MTADHIDRRTPKITQRSTRHVHSMLTNMSPSSSSPARPRSIDSTATAALNLKDTAKRVAAFRGAQDRRAMWELAASAVPLGILWMLMWLSLDVSYGLTLLLSLPAAGFLLRLFLIQHDCGHGSFLKARRANDWLGRCIGVITLSPYDYWRRTHAMHHASTGDLDRRGFGDVATLTVLEFAVLSKFGQLQYRLYRHPFVMFGVGPAFVFLLQHRVPIGLMRAGWRPWISTMGTNAVVALIWSVMIFVIGLGPFLLIQLPMTLIAASIGVWLFFVQHQFEHTYWRGGDEWSFHEAAVYGSSHYILPRGLRWITANIGLHHVHHLCSTIPSYRLPAVLSAHPELGNFNRMTVRESFNLVPLALWDERTRRLVTFKSTSSA
jgi:acyl-lipid omega-6 desaturase (Delta-12 desaturase)